jgi:methylated-DNA-[protein]-cysteine S-methyltransferase
MQNIYFYKTEIGEIAIAMRGDFLTNIFHECRLNLLKNCEFIEQKTKGMEIIFNQIQEYLCGERKIFNVQMVLQGTIFQRNIWEQLIKIPYGETRSYKEIAQQSGVPNSARAVGRANHSNPIPIIVPCHRVIGTSGNLVGYGWGLDLKQKLLILEKNIKLK